MSSSDFETLLDGTVDALPAGELERKLALDRPLRVKLGIDPSRPDLHLGHAVLLRKLHAFQEAGHVAVLIIGDFTARVGDPSGRSELRPMLTAAEVEENARTYLAQAGTVIDLDRAEVRHNSEWLSAMGMDDVLSLTSRTTVAQMLEREDFANRFDRKEPISVVEFLYPLLQGKDSVEIHADVELGGTDQKFNLLMGRELQRDAGQDAQAVLTMPLLVGTDGERKMSKSYDNYVGLTDGPDQMFGRLMSIPDGLIGAYFRYCTDMSPTDVDLIDQGLADGSLHPNDQKRRMAAAIVDLYHGNGSGIQAEGRFDQVHRDRVVPDDVPEAQIPAEHVKDGSVWLPGVLATTGLASSNGEARRLIAQGGVRVDGVPASGEEFPAAALTGAVLQVGRRKFIRLR